MARSFCWCSAGLAPDLVRARRPPRSPRPAASCHRGTQTAETAAARRRDSNPDLAGPSRTPAKRRSSTTIFRPAGIAVWCAGAVLSRDRSTIDDPASGSAPRAPVAVAAIAKFAPLAPMLRRVLPRKSRRPARPPAPRRARLGREPMLRAARSARPAQFLAATGPFGVPATPPLAHAAGTFNRTASTASLPHHRPRGALRRGRRRAARRTRGRRAGARPPPRRFATAVAHENSLEPRVYEVGLDAPVDGCALRAQRRYARRRLRAIAECRRSPRRCR